MVGGEAPQELMRGWGRPPIRKALRPDYGWKIRATHNLAGGCKKESVGVGRGKGEEIAEENLNSQIKIGEGE
jgi:hypothetical protein